MDSDVAKSILSKVYSSKSFRVRELKRTSNFHQICKLDPPKEMSQDEVEELPSCTCKMYAIFEDSLANRLRPGATALAARIIVNSGSHHRLASIHGDLPLRGIQLGSAGFHPANKVALFLGVRHP